MKNMITGFAILAVSVAGCNGSENKTAAGENKVVIDSLALHQQTNASNDAVSVKDIVNSYLQLKNALTNDNSNDAAATGTSLESLFKDFNKTPLSNEQKKIFEDIANDAIEHAGHIGKNGGKITHQREHFEMLSKDMIDLLKTFGNGGLTLYKDFCPMYNDNKGAFWISETKEIKNPFYGKAMSTCGTMKEEIK